MRAAHTPCQVATPTELGGVKPDGTSFTVAPDGTASATPGSSYSLPVATPTVLGGVKPDGSSITNVEGSISVTFGAVAGVAAQGNDPRIVGALQAGDAVSVFAPLASPHFSGAPTAPTATPGTNTTQLATTAFVQASSVGYILPQATTVTLGGIMPDGTTTKTVGGVLSATPQFPPVPFTQGAIAGISDGIGTAPFGPGQGSTYGLPATATNGTLVMWPVFLQNGGSISRFGIRCTTALAGATVYCALYAVGANGSPGALLQNFNNNGVSAAATGSLQNSTAGVTPVTILPGTWVWVAMIAHGAAGTPVFRGILPMIGPQGTNMAGSSGASSAETLAAYTYTTWPGTCPTPTSSGSAGWAPMVAFS